MSGSRASSVTPIGSTGATSGGRHGTYAQMGKWTSSRRRQLARRRPDETPHRPDRTGPLRRPRRGSASRTSTTGMLTGWVARNGAMTSATVVSGATRRRGSRPGSPRPRIAAWARSARPTRSRAMGRKDPTCGRQLRRALRAVERVTPELRLEAGAAAATATAGPRRRPVAAREIEPASTTARK